MAQADDRVAANHDQALLRVLIDHNPNGMRVEHIRPLLDLTDEEIVAAADRLASKGLVNVTDHENTMVPGRVLRNFMLTDPSRYPVRETIRVGAVDFPRMFQGDVVGAEDLNGLTEAIERYNETLDEQIKTLSDSLLRRYWGNTAVLLGLFVAVFALIVKGSETVTTSSSGSTLNLLWRNAAALGPLSIVLLGFVALLALLLRRL